MSETTKTDMILEEFDSIIESNAVLKNRATPPHINQREQPYHRAIIELAAKGYNCEEIAGMVGRHKITVQSTLNQPILQQGLVDAIHRVHGEDEAVVQILKENVVIAMNTLASIMKNPDAKGSDRIAAAKEFLDRKYGKPNQPINRGTEVDLNTLAVAELAAQLPKRN